MEWKQAVIQDAGTNTIVIPPGWVYFKYYEAFNLLFRIENALRVFAYTVLKESHKDKWAEISVSADEQGNSTIAALAKKRQEQAKSFGYLGHAVSCPIMHLTSGELTRLMVDDAYWKLFNPYFRGSKEVIRNKLEEIATIRNSLAHFRPIRDDDVTTIKHNAKHVLVGIEEYLSQVLSQVDPVPTNTAEEWYRNLQGLASEHCSTAFYQSNDCRWLRIELAFLAPVLQHRVLYPGHQQAEVLTVDSSYVLLSDPALTSSLTYLSERVSWGRMPEEGFPTFTKSLSFVFSKKAVSDGNDLRNSFLALLQQIENEAEVMLRDNRARGKRVYPVPVAAYFQGDPQGTGVWRIEQGLLQTSVRPGDPPEFWGSAGFFPESFITMAHSYPWMPEQVSDFDLPF